MKLEAALVAAIDHARLHGMREAALFMAMSLEGFRRRHADQLSGSEDNGTTH